MNTTEQIIKLIADLDMVKIFIEKEDELNKEFASVISTMSAALKEHRDELIEIKERLDKIEEQRLTRLN